MKYRFLIVFFLSIAICGCTTLYEQHEIVDDPDPTIRRFISLHQIQEGLTSAEVKAVLGSQVIIGYEMPDTREKRYAPIVITNPHRVERHESGRRMYAIEYYFVGINSADAEITDDELTPLIFEEDSLIGWGWDFLKKIKP